MFEFENSATLSELVLKAQTGNREAFTELVLRFKMQIYRWAYAILQDEHEAEDLVQEVSLRAWRKIHQVEQHAAFSGWLQQMTRRLAYSRVGRRSMVVDSDLAGAERVAGEESSELDADTLEEIRAQLSEGMAGLSSSDRSALEARFFQKMSYKDMADFFQAPLGTVKRRVHVAVGRLAKRLEKRMIA